MMSCKEVSVLVSESLDRKIGFFQLMGLRMHLAMCHVCRGYRLQMIILRKALRRALALPHSGDFPGSALSPEAKTRIKTALARQG